MARAPILRQWAPQLLSVLRIVAGLLLFAHGLQKIAGFPPGAMANMPFTSLPAYAGAIEFVCGLLIAIGFFTRAAAFLASGTMAAAYWIAHAPQSPFPVNNSGDAAILYCFLFLYLVFAGPGPWSIDALRRRRREERY